MDEKHKKVLTRSLVEIVHSLDPNDVLPYLLSKEIISANDYERFCTFNTTREKVTNFILSLQTKGPNAFQYFMEALQQHFIYDHLVSKLEDCLKEYEEREHRMTDKWQWIPMSDYQSYAIDYCKNSLTSKLPFEDACEYFFKVGLLKRENINFMKELPEPSSQRSFFVEYVKGKGVVAYDLLMDFLLSSNPDLEKAIREAEKARKEREDALKTLVTFTFKHKDIKDYIDVPRQLNIILIGKTGSGKSSTGNTIVGKEGVFREVSGSASGTQTIQKETVEKHNLEINLLDTPGLFDTSSTLSNQDILLEIMKTAQEFAQGVHVFLFVCRGDVRFTKEEMKTFDDIQEYFGENLLKHCLLVVTHADSFVEETTFNEHLENNQKLHAIFQKASKKAIAVTNKDNLLICRDKIREQLIHAIVDVVSSNDGQPFSSSIFETARKELEKERGRSKVKEKLDLFTFNFLIYEFPTKSLSQLSAGLEISKSEVNVIVKLLSDYEKSLFSKNEVGRIIQNYIKDHKEFITRLLQNKTEDQEVVRNIKTKHQKECFPDTILHYVLKCFQTFPDVTLNELKAGNGLSEEDIQRIVNRSPFQKVTYTTSQQSSLILEYVDIIVNAFKRQKQRHELVECIHSECNHVIKEYFTTKSFMERSEVIKTFIIRGYIPPDLHCRCLQVIPRKFKSACSWDSTIEKVLLQTLVDRVYTENATLMSLSDLIKDTRKATTAVLISILPLLAAANPLAEKTMTFGIIAAGVVWKAYDARRAFFPSTNCNECNSRHRPKNFKPLT